MKVCEIPSDLESERAAIGSSLVYFDDLDVFMDSIKEEMLFDNRHKEIYKALKYIWMNDYKPSSIGVASILVDMELLEKAGGLAYLKDLEMSFANTLMPHYCEKIIEAYKLRELMLASEKTMSMANQKESSEDIQNILGRVIETVNGVDIKQPESVSNIIDDMNDGKSFEEIIGEEYQRHKNGEKGIIGGISTGFEQLDNLLGGLIKKRLIILGARPSMGKSEFIVQMISRIAKLDVPCMIFSLEMTGEEWVRRLIGISASVHFSKFKTMNDLQYEQIIQAGKWAKDTFKNIIIDDDAGVTIEKIKARARREILKSGIKAIFIDHLGIIEESKKSSSIYEKVSFLSRKLKLMAKELNVPVFCLCQLNRNVEKREEKKPTMADLRDSGSIEQDADAVVLLHRPDYNDPYDRPGMVQLIVDKNRHGERGRVELVFNFETARLEEVKKF